MQKIQEMQVWSLGQEDPPGEGNGNPLQYSSLENPMDRGTWRATVHGVSKSRTRQRDWITTTFWIKVIRFFFFAFFFFIFGGFCHTLKWNSQGFTCVPHTNPPSHLPLHPFPLGFPSAPGPSTCLILNAKSKACSRCHSGLGRCQAVKLGWKHGCCSSEACSY